MKDYFIKEDVFMALTGDITDCTIEEFIARLRDKLSKLPSVGKDINVTTNEDCISRQSIKRKLQENHDFFINAYGNFNNMPQDDKSRVDEIINCIAMVVNEPPVTPKGKTGHWEYVQYDYNPNIGNWHCSECRSIVIMCVNKKETGGTLYKYCPNCGARMVEPQESEDIDGNS